MTCGRDRTKAWRARRHRSKVTDSLGATSRELFLVNVQNVSPRIDSLTARSPIPPGQASALALSFSDPGSIDTFRLVIDWGDRTSTSLVLAGGTRRELARNESGATGGKATRILMVIAWTLSLRNQSWRSRVGRRSSGEKVVRLQ